MQRRVLLQAAVCSVLSLGMVGHARALGETIELRRAMLSPAPEAEAWQLNADIDISLPGRLEEAVNRGVPLHFILEVDVARSRWYWLNEKLVSLNQVFRLSFNALSRSFRVSSLQNQQQYPTLSEALADLGQLRNLRVAPLDRIKLDSNTFGFARMRLDVSQLPKPLQLSAITNKELTLQSEWTRLQFPDPASNTAR
jgi:hypothetical protein